MGRRKDRARRTVETKEPRVPRLVRVLLFAHLLLSPLVFSGATLDSFEYPKVALLVTVALVVLAAGTVALANAPRGTLRAWGASVAGQPTAASVLLLAASATVSTCLSLSPRTSWLQAGTWLLYVFPVMTLFLRPQRPGTPAPAGTFPEQVTVE